MASERLTEISVELITDHIRDNIDASLADVRTDRPDNKVTTIPPRSYFIHEKAKGYRPPAVFVLSSGADFRLERGANFISALERMQIAVVVHDRNETLLTRKCWRYQSALAKLLHNTELVDVPAKLKIIIKTVSTSFSPVLPVEAGGTNDFKKEVSIEIEVEHYENF